MLGFVPTLYEDELLYSWFARYHAYANNSGPKQTMMDLFGMDSELAVPDLPVNLIEPSQRVSHFMGENQAEQWIEHHTFFRFYTAFSLPEIRDKTRKAMLSAAGSSALHMMTGVMANCVKEKDVFYYCADCFAENLQTRGELIWHLTHQLPGMLYCIRHEQELSRSRVPFRPVNRHEFVPATTENCLTLVHLAVYSTKVKEHLLAIAHEITELVRTGLRFDLNKLQAAYKNLLRKKGLVRGNGSVKQVELARLFQSFYGEECLQILQSEVRKHSEACWLKAITRKHRKSFHPIRHLLLIHFLGESVGTVCMHEEYIPFGKGPFPCLNRAADHYLQSVVENVQITRCTDTGRPVGTFTCSCGFQYSKRGPDQSEKDRYRIGRIKQFGDVWLARLCHMIHIEKVSFRAAAKALGVDTKTAMKHSGFSHSSAKPQSIEKSELRKRKQVEWMDLISKNPSQSITGLRSLNLALYSWLYRNCREWLKSSVSSGSRTHGHVRINWEMRDKRLAKELEKAAHDVLRMLKPERVTLGRISTRVGKRALLDRHLSKLPHCKRIIIKVRETVEQFQVRRVSWAARQLAETGEELAAWRIWRVAGLPEQINEVVESEIQKLVHRVEETGRSIV